MRARRGFTLLEVMISTGILVVSLVVLVQTQWTAAEMTFEADRIVAATHLAQEKLAEVRMQVEREGFQQADVYDEGDFDDFGDEALNVEFEDLEDYHWEFLVTEVDLELAADLNGTMQQLMGSLGGDAADPAASTAVSGMSGLISPEMITDALDPFVREARVRVWWGEDSEEAEEIGNEVVITTHLVNPSGNMMGGMPGGAGTLR